MCLKACPSFRYQGSELRNPINGVWKEFQLWQISVLKNCKECRYGDEVPVYVPQGTEQQYIIKAEEELILTFDSKGKKEDEFCTCSVKRRRRRTCMQLEEEECEGR